MLGPGIGGCGTVIKPEPLGIASEGGPTRAVVRGDWDDLEAAAAVACGWAEMALTSFEAGGPDSAVLTLVTVDDRPVTVTARREPDSVIALEARVGHFGREADERRILGAIARRLDQLHRREWAPIR